MRTMAEVGEGFSRVFAVLARRGANLPLKSCPRNDYEDHSDDKEDNRQQFFHCFLLLQAITGRQLWYDALLSGDVPREPFSRRADAEPATGASAYWYLFWDYPPKRGEVSIFFSNRPTTQEIRNLLQAGMDITLADWPAPCRGYPRLRFLSV